MNPPRLLKQSAYEWRLQKTAAARVPGLLFLSEKLAAELDPAAAAQLANVAALPGLADAVYACPTRIPATGS